ncbi:MAG: sporulation integral membrane protein YtvI [Lachnospiraceae bacterium]
MGSVMKHVTKTYFKIILNIILFIASVMLVVWLLPKILYFFIPFVVAWILSAIVSPIVKTVERRLKLKRKASLVFVIISIITIVTMLIYLAFSQLVYLFSDFLGYLPTIWEDVRLESLALWDGIEEMLVLLPDQTVDAIHDLIENSGEWIAEFLGNISTPTIVVISNIAMKLPNVIIFTIMCFLATYFFVAEGEGIANQIKKIMPQIVLDRWESVKHSVLRSIGGYVKAQFKIEVWVYLLVFIGLTILRVNYAIIIALAIAILDLLPVFGTGAVLWPWALWVAIHGQYMMAAALMAVWALSQLVRQILQPKFVGDSLGVAPLQTLILLYLGYKLGGVVGMILAIPIALLILTLYKEGLFKVIEQTLLLLLAKINKFRHYDEDELEEIEIYKKHYRDGKSEK